MTAPMNPDYSIREGFAAMDFARVHAWLAASYWTPGIARERVECGARNSALVVGAFDADGVQAAYARIVSDKTRFAYLCDVIVDEAHRRRGLASRLVKFALEHPDFATITTWTLATRDAQPVYAALGFQTMTEPESRPRNFMIQRFNRAP